MRSFITCTGILIVFASGYLTGSQQPAADIIESLKEADRQFAADTARRGLDGWISAYASDAVRLELGGEIVQGTEAIRKADAKLFADPQTQLRWQPTHAAVFADNQQGVTTGNYQVVRTAADSDQSAVIARGHYVSIWRRTPAGWKVMLDTGCPAQEPAPPQ